MKYKSVIEYYEKKSHDLRDEAERIADELFTCELQRLNGSDLPDTFKSQLKHFNRSIRGELFSIRLHISMIQFYLIDPNWWNTTHKPTPNNEQICHMLEAYDMSIKRGYIIGVFSIIEHCFRHLLRKLEDKKASLEDFWQVREKILSLLVKDKAAHYKSMLGLYANIRNTVHNDGLFFPKNGLDIEIIYKNRKYLFKSEAPIDFVEWELLFELTEDIANLLHDLSFCNDLKSQYYPNEEQL